ncbi:hypothetical protein [Mucilaginibacter sp.]
MLKSTSTKIIILIAVICYGILLLNTVTTKHVNNKNVNIITGHFNGIHEFFGKGEHHYTIYLTEGNKAYSTGDYSSSCFSYSYFKNAVKIGDMVKIYISQNSYLTNSEVVAVDAGKWEYMTFDCFNKQVDKNKIIIPLWGAFYAICLTGMLIGLIERFKGSRSYQKNYN